MFKDESIFEGVKECDTPYGRVQFRDKGANFEIYELGDRVWVHKLTLGYRHAKVKWNSSCDDLFSAYEKVMDAMEGGE